MNILLVVPWDQTHGGVAAVVNNLGKQLRENGHHVTFFHPHGRAVLLRAGETKIGFLGYKLRLGVPVVGRYPLLSTLAAFALFPTTILQLLWVIRNRRIDVINVHYPGPAFGYFALCRLMARIRLVTSVHGADIFPRGRVRPRYAAPLRFLFQRSDAIVANSSAFQEDFLRLFPRLREKTTFIHNGVDLAELETEAGESIRSIGRYILCVAAHNEKKALDVLLRAFALLDHSPEPLKLVLVGDGPLRGGLEALAAALQLEGQVIFAGEKTRGEVAALLQGCEFFVLPSRSEPFGIAIVEAMAVGKAVVATRTGGIPELIEDGKEGLLVEPDNHTALAQALRHLLDNAELRVQMGARGKVTVLDRFRWRNTGSAYIHLFEAVRSRPD
jgi:L-malate glycosyltransferase